ncbi:urease accessory protein UreD [cf. Phormidesmis sp. LEGE 11477]|uniref:urease accessory protein UreD n=1 Tax=cf. Phormidesmis sp. LEGE 11477 TaxID=1828680 RepID=UPI0018823461|nr:urease accessory protein UreD [cf. Phormidesmis sp. LEGE 11477]MBE9062546.1 urease accessory protein UreD [cf. Phormidesmis sp. LEGE 11477]
MVPTTLPQAEQRIESQSDDQKVAGKKVTGAASSSSPLHLSMRVAQAANANQTSQSFVAHQYASYPFRLSSNLRLDRADAERVYAYIMSAAPGVLSGDDLRLRVEVGDQACLYLTDQSATKVHSKPVDGLPAQVIWEIQVGKEAYFEYVLEPIILFDSAALTQRVEVTLHPSGRFISGEIIVPGRIARGEFYEFEQFESRLRVRSPDGRICFADNLRLTGQANRFKHSAFVTEYPLLGNFVAVVPGIALDDLLRKLQQHEIPADTLQACESPLPGCNGILVRAIATKVNALKTYQRYLLNCIRQLAAQPLLPIIPK